MRFLFAVALLACGCAHLGERPVQETPAAKLFVRDHDKDGRRQWYLEVVGPAEKKEKPELIFDEENPALFPPATPLTLTAKPFVPGDPLPGFYLTYRLLLVTDNPPAGRGVIYLFAKESNEAHPMVWWGLSSDPRFDDASPAANWAALQALFKK